MELQQFVAETLSQLVLGVKDAQSKVKETGGRIVPYGVGEETSYAGHTVSNVEFDVAITVAEDNQKKGSLGVQIAWVSIGGGGESKNTNTTVSRVRFSVPVGWPTG